MIASPSSTKLLICWSSDEVRSIWRSVPYKPLFALLSSLLASKSVSGRATDWEFASKCCERTSDKPEFVYKMQRNNHKHGVQQSNCKQRWSKFWLGRQKSLAYLSWMCLLTESSLLANLVRFASRFAFSAEPRSKIYSNYPTFSFCYCTRDASALF